jgi:hypothetical protein
VNERQALGRRTYHASRARDHRKTPNIGSTRATAGPAVSHGASTRRRPGKRTPWTRTTAHMPCRSLPRARAAGRGSAGCRRRHLGEDRRGAEDPRPDRNALFVMRSRRSMTMRSSPFFDMDREERLRNAQHALQLRPEHRAGVGWESYATIIASAEDMRAVVFAAQLASAAAAAVTVTTASRARTRAVNRLDLDANLIGIALDVAAHRALGFVAASNRSNECDAHYHEDPHRSIPQAPRHGSSVTSTVGRTAANPGDLQREIDIGVLPGRCRRHPTGCDVGVSAAYAGLVLHVRRSATDRGTVFTAAGDRPGR